LKNGNINKNMLNNVFIVFFIESWYGMKCKALCILYFIPLHIQFSIYRKSQNKVIFHFSQIFNNNRNFTNGNIVETHLHYKSSHCNFHKKQTYSLIFSILLIFFIKSGFFIKLLSNFYNPPIDENEKIVFFEVKWRMPQR
jgi:hypothetical protein